MEQNPYQAPAETDAVLQSERASTRGQDARRWGLRLGAVSVVSFFSLFPVMAIMADAGTTTTTAELVVLGLVLLSAASGITALALLIAGALARVTCF